MAVCSVARAADEPVDIHELAKKLSREATDAYAAGRYEEADAKFQQAYLLFPAPQLVLNLSRTELKLGHCDKAIAYALTYGTIFEQQSGEARDSPESWLSRVKGECPEVEITSTPPGVSITLKGAVPTVPIVTPFKGRLPAGEYSVQASRAGYEDQEATLRVDAAVPSHLQLALARSPHGADSDLRNGTLRQAGDTRAPDANAPVSLSPTRAETHPAWSEASTDAAQPARPTLSPGRAAGVASIVVGGLALATAVALGVSASDDTMTAETKTPTEPLQTQLSSIRGRAIGADALFGIGGVLAAVGIGLTVALR